MVAIVRQDETRMCCIRIQSHLHWKLLDALQLSMFSFIFIFLNTKVCLEAQLVIDRRDNQRSRVSTTVIHFGTVERMEFLSEGAASKGFEMIWILYIIKGDLTNLIVHKHFNLLRSGFQGEKFKLDNVTIILIYFPQRYSPETILRTRCDPSIPVSRISGDSHSPVSLHFNLNLKVKSSRWETLLS